MSKDWVSHGTVWADGDNGDGWHIHLIAWDPELDLFKVAHISVTHDPDTSHCEFEVLHVTEVAYP